MYKKKIINIHIKGKPCEDDVIIDDLVHLTNGLSSAQIEGVLNEAMLKVLRENKTKMKLTDIQQMIYRDVAGWQPTQNMFSPKMIQSVAITS